MSNWSVFQNKIFEFVENESGNAIIEAVAGSGKTTTIVEALRRVKGSSIFLAFNKSIASELKERGVNARTFHSLTYNPVLKALGVNVVEQAKLEKICKGWIEKKDLLMYGNFIQRLVGLGRQVGLDCLVPATDESWFEIIGHHDLELNHEDADVERGVSLANELLFRSNNSSMVDFDDLLYLAVKNRINLPKFDVVFVDEAQDTNAIQREILRKIMKPRSRLVAVGDPAQAIYGFRGADSDSMDLIAKEFRCEKLPLSISYRCATKIIEYAQTWVPHIQARDEAPEGEVKDFGEKWKTSDFSPEDLVVCRTTAPTIKLAFQLLRDRIPAYVMGRDICKGLKQLIEKMKATDLTNLESRLHNYHIRERANLMEKDQRAKAEALNDKISALMFLIDQAPENDRSIAYVLALIDQLFSDKSQAVILSTIHKSKGLEANRVFWLNRYSCPSPWASKPWQIKQEENLCYVATTRAKIFLGLIEMPKD